MTPWYVKDSLFWRVNSAASNHFAIFAAPDTSSNWAGYSYYVLEPDNVIEMWSWWCTLNTHVCELFAVSPNTVDLICDNGFIHRSRDDPLRRGVIRSVQLTKLNRPNRAGGKPHGLRPAGTGQHSVNASNTACTTPLLLPGCFTKN